MKKIADLFRGLARNFAEVRSVFQIHPNPPLKSFYAYHEVTAFYFLSFVFVFIILQLLFFFKYANASLRTGSYAPTVPLINLRQATPVSLSSPCL